MPPTPDAVAGPALDSRRIRALRPARAPVDPWSALGTVRERERTVEGGEVETLTVFLAGAECPFTCVFCDLWKHTLEGATPAGAIPAQLAAVLKEERPPPGSAIKLYNASNFFDRRAVPPEDDDSILSLLSPFSRVTVECHPRLIGRRCLAFAERLTGTLEVAMGLETIHPEAFPRLNKGMTLEQFDRAVGLLTPAGVAVRAFVLVGAPFVPSGQAVEWAVRSARWALERGVGRVCLIPLRAGNGAMERLRAEGVFVPPTLEDLEESLERALALGAGIVTADTWDAEDFARCSLCAPARIARLERMNLSGRIEPPVPCAVCGGG